MPESMPTPCIDGVRRASTVERVTELKPLNWNNLSKSVSTGMPMSKLLILFFFLVRDQEVGGSNPLAPTNYTSCFHWNAAVGAFALSISVSELCPELCKHLRGGHSDAWWRSRCGRLSKP